MFWFLLAVVAVGFVVWKLRVKVLAKALGQPEHRIARRLNQKRR